MAYEAWLDCHCANEHKRAMVPLNRGWTPARGAHTIRACSVSTMDDKLMATLHKEPHRVIILDWPEEKSAYNALSMLRHHILNDIDFDHVEAAKLVTQIMGWLDDG